MLEYLYRRLQPALFRLEPERAHALITRLLDASVRVPGLAQHLTTVHDPLLATTIAGVRVTNPLGLAAGFDKDGRHIAGMAALGFGFLELGTVTPQAQAGNPRPRLFRLAEDRALINRMGFNNAGAAALARRLERTQRPVPLGINLGKNKTTPNPQAADDYVRGVQQLGQYADYLVVNISSPNTPGLRELSQREPLTALLQAVQAARSQLVLPAGRHRPPLLVKLSPDETAAGLDAALAATLASGADGIIATNTTVARTGLRGASAREAGGLSGAPLEQRALEVLRYLYQATAGQLPLIGVGGIATAEQAYARICAGASGLQLYTALIYSGPGLISQLNQGLAGRLRRDGHASLASAVGSLARG